MRTPVCAILLFLATVNANVDTVLLRHETEEALEIAEIIAFGNRTVARYFQSVLFDEKDSLGAKLRKDLSQLNRFAYALPYKWGKGLEIEFALELMSAYADLIEIKRSKRFAFGQKLNRRRKREANPELDVPDLDIIVEEPEDEDYATLADDEDYTDEPEQESTKVPSLPASLLSSAATASSSELPTAPSTIESSSYPASDVTGASEILSEGSSAVSESSSLPTRSSLETEVPSFSPSELPSSLQTEVPLSFPTEAPSSSQSEVPSSSATEKSVPTVVPSSSLASDASKISSDGSSAAAESSSLPTLSSSETEVPSSSQSELPSLSSSQSSSSLPSDATELPRLSPSPSIELTMPSESPSSSSSAAASLGSSETSPTNVPVSSTQLPSESTTASSVQSSTQATIVITKSSSSAPISTQSPIASSLAPKKLVTIPLKNIYVTATIKQATPRPNSPKKVAYLTVREIGEIIERVARSKEYDESRIREDLIQYVNHLDKTSSAKYMKRLTIDLIRRGVRPIRQKWQPYMFTVLRFDDRWGTRNL